MQAMPILTEFHTTLCQCRPCQFSLNSIQHYANAGHANVHWIPYNIMPMQAMPILTEFHTTLCQCRPCQFPLNSIQHYANAGHANSHWIPYNIMPMQAERTSETSVDNYFTRQYIPEDKSELKTKLFIQWPFSSTAYLIRKPQLLCRTRIAES
jgi:hypothetical protein